jgi:hypothetical protein
LKNRPYSQFSSLKLIGIWALNVALKLAIFSKNALKILKNTENEQLAASIPSPNPNQFQ